MVINDFTARSFLMASLYQISCLIHAANIHLLCNQSSSPVALLVTDFLT